MLLTIIFFILNFKKVSTNIITEQIYSQPFLSNIVNEVIPFYSYASTYSNNFYSNNFYSNNFYSNNFLQSNSFLGRSNYISYSFYTSNIGCSNSQNLFKSMHPWSMLSVPTTQPTILLTNYPTFLPSQQPTFIPTFEQTHISTVKPTNLPTVLPIIKPTFLPTPMPTKSNISLLKVETSITLSGFTQKVLDNNSLTSIILTIAQSANISLNYVSIKEYSFVNARRRYLTFTLASLYNLFLVSQITVPLINNNLNPSSLYTSITNNIQNSISSGAFITYLLNNAAALNSSIINNNMTISNYSISQMIIINNSPTLMPTFISYGKSTNNLSSIYVVKLVFITMACFIIFLIIFGVIVKKVNNYNDNNNNIISHNEIQINV